MGLVGYSDSEESDTENVKPAPAAKSAAPTTSSAKPTFQKLVDKANPGKIRLDLPSSKSSGSGGQQEGGDHDAPPAKRAKTGGGFSGFNAMLPAPKKAAQQSGSGVGAPKRGLGVGVSLKTSGQAAFSRVPVESTEQYDEYGSSNGVAQDGGNHDALGERREPEIKLVGKPTVFRPLSVANKGKRKKTVAEVSAAAARPAAPVPTSTARRPPPPAAAPASAPSKPKVSLFSLDAKEEPPSLAPDPVDEEDDEPDEDYWPGATTTQQQNAPTLQANSIQANDLAADLNLTASERRQLFGRQGKGSDLSAINIVNFNTDDEYARNEVLRASGEAEAAAQQNRGVKAIAPGKHSLKQLVNAATSQKDALEDSFAQGRRNKKEAGNKYGW